METVNAVFQVLCQVLVPVRALSLAFPPLRVDVLALLRKMQIELVRSNSGGWVSLSAMSTTLFHPKSQSAHPRELSSLPPPMATVTDLTRNGYHPGNAPHSHAHINSSSMNDFNRPPTRGDAYTCNDRSNDRHARNLNDYGSGSAQSSVNSMGNDNAFFVHQRIDSLYKELAMLNV